MSKMSKKTLGLSTTPVKVFLYFTGTWLAFVDITLLNYLSALALQLIRVIFYAFLKFLDSSILWILQENFRYSFLHFSHVKRGNGHNLCNFISLYRSNFRGKTELFSNFLAQQCTLMDNASEIPSTLNIKTAKTLSSIPVTRADIAKIIKKRCKWFLFKSCFESNMFLSEWRKQM